MCKVYGALNEVDALIALKNEPDCQSAGRRGAIEAVKPQFNSFTYAN